MIRILIVDDHGVVRRGLEQLLESHPDMTVVGAAADGEQAIAMAADLRPDVILMDLSMPVLD
nr:response regulator [Geodermatophilaceae bacterium]